YIELISDIIRHLHLLLMCRSSCPIIKSCLAVIADGLEFVFNTKSTDFCQDIQLLFNSDKKRFNHYENDLDKIGEQKLININNSQISNDDDDELMILLFNDENTIKTLAKLYNFYEINSEQINQHIGENHVSVLLPIHHSLLQIRQLLKSIQLPSSTNSSNILTDTTLI
ncbi:unnamed protein product, partial [Didymodactylos carnosus]